MRINGKSGRTRNTAWINHSYQQAVRNYDFKVRSTQTSGKEISH